VQEFGRGQDLRVAEVLVQDLVAQPFAATLDTEMHKQALRPGQEPGLVLGEEIAPDIELEGQIDLAIVALEQFEHARLILVEGVVDELDLRHLAGFLQFAQLGEHVLKGAEAHLGRAGAGFLAHQRVGAERTGMHAPPRGEDHEGMRVVATEIEEIPVHPGQPVEVPDDIEGLGAEAVFAAQEVEILHRRTAGLEVLDEVEQRLFPLPSAQVIDLVDAEARGQEGRSITTENDR